MIKKLQKRFALSKQGAVDLIKACIAFAAQGLTFMFPVGLLYFFVIDMMNGGVSGSRTAFYVIGTIICLALIYIATWFQYNTAYLATYVESGVRPVSYTHLDVYKRQTIHAAQIKIFLFAGMRRRTGFTSVSLCLSLISLVLSLIHISCNHGKASRS